MHLRQRLCHVQNTPKVINPVLCDSNMAGFTHWVKDWTVLNLSVSDQCQCLLAIETSLIVEHTHGDQSCAGNWNIMKENNQSINHTIYYSL